MFFQTRNCLRVGNSKLGVGIGFSGSGWEGRALSGAGQLVDHDSSLMVICLGNGYVCGSELKSLAKVLT